MLTIGEDPPGVGGTGLVSPHATEGSRGRCLGLSSWDSETSRLPVSPSLDSEPPLCGRAKHLLPLDFPWAEPGEVSAQCGLPDWIRR